MKKIKKTIKFYPFSDKQYETIMEALEPKTWLSVLEGGKRAGKNVTSLYAYSIIVEQHEDHLHLAAGFNLATAETNIIDCNGYGLEHMFKGRCRWGKYKGNKALYVKTSKGEKVIVVAGGGKADSYKRIKGMTFGTAYLDEVNEMHPSFVKEVRDRTLTSSCRKQIWTLNPKEPSHWLYEEFLDVFQKEQIPGYSYHHYTIIDNPSIDPDNLEIIMISYDKNSIWYKRDILGQRIKAEGIIYKAWSDSFIIQSLGANDRMAIVYGGVDFGGTDSATTFNLVGITQNYKKVIILDEHYDKENKSTESVINDFEKWVLKCKAMYPQLNDIYCDSAEQLMIKSFRNLGLPVNIRNAKKSRILDRIKLFDILMTQGRVFFMQHCKHTIEAFQNAVWNPEATDERLDDGTTNIDSLDSTEYAIEREMPNLIAIAAA